MGQQMLTWQDLSVVDMPPLELCLFKKVPARTFFKSQSITLAPTPLLRISSRCLRQMLKVPPVSLDLLLTA